MNSEEKIKIIVIAPFWGRSDHIGRYRIERIVRWLVSDNYRVIVVWSGLEDNLVEKDKWIEVEIRDPLRRFTRKINNRTNIVLTEKQIKKSFSLRILIQKIVFYFDRELVWSIWLTKKAMIKNVCKNAQAVISSSPPESSHLASYILAKKNNLKLLIDMRDGWLDEPMRLYREKWSLKRTIEMRWEFKIIRNASRIFVTSDNWKKLLEHRLPIATNKTTVLTNAYPVDYEVNQNILNRDSSSRIILLHAGRFKGTRSTNKISILLQPLYNILKSKINLEFNIVLLGDLMSEDYNELKYWREQFSSTHSEVITKERVTRMEMYAELAKANGLLLLAATKAFIPSKTFEYIKSAKPILAVTSKSSSIWELGQKVPQMFLFDYTAQKPDYRPVKEFLNACQTGVYEYKIPEEYSEEYLSKIFLSTIDKI